jgi:hypothetical protein
MNDRGLMVRLGHATSDAALRYQDATKERDRVIAEALAEMALPAPVVAIDSGKKVPARKSLSRAECAMNVPWTNPGKRMGRLETPSDQAFR